MNATTSIFVPGGNDVLAIGLSVVPVFKNGAFTARAELRTSHYRADVNNFVLKWPDGSAMQVGPTVLETHNDVFAEAAGDGTPDPGQAALQTAVQAAIATYLSSASPAFTGQPIQQAFAGAVIAIQTALAVYCAAAGK